MSELPVPRVCALLHKHGAHYVLVGAQAAILHGYEDSSAERFAFRGKLPHVLGMKRLPLFLIILAAVAFAGGAFGESAQQLLTAAQVAYQKGDYEAAKRDFEMVLRIEPRNPTANGFMRLLNAQLAKDGGGAATEKALAQLIIPQLQFKEATLGSALDFMKKKAAELSGGKQAVNFVVQPGVDQNGTTVTVNLTNIPFTEALRYVGELANITFQYQKYAIVVRPRSAVANNAPVPPAGKTPAQ